MSRLVVVLALLAGAGGALLLSEHRWFRRPSLLARLAPYAPASGRAGPARSGPATTWRSLAHQVAPRWGARLAGAFGVREDLAVRLNRIHADPDVTAFRTRQLGWSLAALAIALPVVVATAPPPLVGLLVLLGLPLLAFLVPEQRLATASARWQDRLRQELPVVTEQLGMLLAAGYSLGGALSRLAERGDGAASQDLRRVCGRLRQGVAEEVALAEWARLAQVDGLDRLVGVLALNRDAGDLGALITEEARSMRRDAHRRLIERIERRSEQVWIPVTVATLLPGVIFLVIPFIDALQLFTGG